MVGAPSKPLFLKCHPIVSHGLSLPGLAWRSPKDLHAPARSCLWPAFLLRGDQCHCQQRLLARAREEAGGRGTSPRGTRPTAAYCRQSATGSGTIAQWGRRSVWTKRLATRRSGRVTVIPTRTVQPTRFASGEMTCLCRRREVARTALAVRIGGRGEGRNGSHRGQKRAHDKNRSDRIHTSKHG